MVLLDSDDPGKRMAKELKSSLYAEAQDKILDVAMYTGIDGSEIEDLIPVDLMCSSVDKWQRGPEEAFVDACRPGVPVIDQIEVWAAAHNIVLASPAWKVELAKRVKQSLLAKQADTIPQTYLRKWEELFMRMLE